VLQENVAQENVAQETNHNFTLLCTYRAKSTSTILYIVVDNLPNLNYFLFNPRYFLLNLYTFTSQIVTILIKVYYTKEIVMKHLLLVTLLLFTFTGCGEADKKTSKASKQQKDKLMLELKAKDEALQKARAETKILQNKILQAEQAQKEAFLKVAKQKEALDKRTATNNKLSPIGIHLEDHKITIDTNKTKQFFQNLGKRFEGKIEKLAKDIKKGFVDQKEAGVHIDESHINIDLNQSKHFLNLWSGKMQSFVKEFNSIAQEAQKQTNK